MEVFVRHDAELDALGYFQYLHERNPDAALRFLAAIDPTVEGLAGQPMKGRLRRFRGSDLKSIREGVIPIEMVDGERLVELFEARQLGLRRKEVFEVDHSFFDQFR